MVRVRQRPIQAHLQGDARLSRPGSRRKQGEWRQGAWAVDRGRGGGWDGGGEGGGGGGVAISDRCLIIAITHIYEFT